MLIYCNPEGNYISGRCQTTIAQLETLLAKQFNIEMWQPLLLLPLLYFFLFSAAVGNFGHRSVTPLTVKRSWQIPQRANFARRHKGWEDGANGSKSISFSSKRNGPEMHLQTVVKENYYRTVNRSFSFPSKYVVDVLVQLGLISAFNFIALTLHIQAKDSFFSPFHDWWSTDIYFILIVCTVM